MSFLLPGVRVVLQRFFPQHNQSTTASGSYPVPAGGPHIFTATSAGESLNMDLGVGERVVLGTS